MEAELEVCKASAEELLDLLLNKFSFILPLVVTFFAIQFAMKILCGIVDDGTPLITWDDVKSIGHWFKTLIPRIRKWYADLQKGYDFCDERDCVAYGWKCHLCPYGRDLKKQLEEEENLHEQEEKLRQEIKEHFEPEIEKVTSCRDCPFNGCTAICVRCGHSEDKPPKKGKKKP